MGQKLRSLRIPFLFHVSALKLKNVSKRFKELAHIYTCVIINV